MNEEATGKYASRVISKNAVPVIYGVSTSSSEVLYRMIVNLKNDLESNNLHLLVDSQDVTSYLNSQYKYYKIEDQEFKSRILDPYVQTTRFVNEAVNLVSTVQGGYIKLKEKPGRRKDRVMALVYLDFLIKILEGQYAVDEEDNSFMDYIISC